MEEPSPVLGIDLGTTYSCVAVYQNAMVEVIANDQGSRTTPSYVAFTPNGRLIGDAARAMAVDRNLPDKEIKNIVYDIKRIIGRKFDDDSVREAMKHFTFNVKEENGNPTIQVESDGEVKHFEPQGISAMILGKLKNIAEDYLGMAVKDTVITVPVHFNDDQRKATMDAGTLAGLNVLRIINEPQAAAMAYGLGKCEKMEKNVLIFGMGGGILDVTILTIWGGIFEVKSNRVNAHLGGQDFDQQLVDYFIGEINTKYDINISRNKKSIRRLRAACEQLKRGLSVNKYETIEVEALINSVTDFKSSISRAKFEAFCQDLFDSALGPC